MVTVNRQSYLYTGYFSPLLLFVPCHGLTNEVAAHFFSSKYRSCSNQPITWLHNCHEFCNYCCDAFLPRYHVRIDTRLSPSVFTFHRRGEPGNEASMEVYVDVCVWMCVVCEREEEGEKERVEHYLTTISLLEMCLGNSDTK